MTSRPPQNQKAVKRIQHSRDPQGALERMLGYATVLNAEYPELERRFKAWSKSGYPAKTGAGGRGSGPKIVVPDENGQPDTVSITTVEAQVFDGDDVADMRQRFNAQVSEALGLFNALWKIRDDIMGEPAREAVERQNRLQKCSNQYGCPDDAWAVKAGRCGACYQYRYRNDRDRTGREPTEDVA